MDLTGQFLFLRTVIDGRAECRIIYVEDRAIPAADPDAPEPCFGSNMRFLPEPPTVFVATVTIEHEDKFSAGLKQLFVHPQWRRRGIARALLERCAELARSSGCSSIGLTVDVKNLDVVAFYERCGYLAAYQYDEGGIIMCHPLR